VEPVGRAVGNHRSLPTCQNCGERIEWCNGKHGDFMHVRTRKEACDPTKTGAARRNSTTTLYAELRYRS
jgi:hypothetical protein